MHYLYIITIGSIIFSFLKDRRKTFQGLKIAVHKLIDIMPAIITMLIFVSVILYLVPDKVIYSYLGSKNNTILIGVFLGSFFGSITIMPGFIAFPLAGILLKKGVSYMVLSAFTTTLMIVGILTFPIEKEYFGVKVALIRNIIGLFIALTVAIVTGFFFGELF